jgi:phosphohistidine swiveling domain-containing protein
MIRVHIAKHESNHKKQAETFSLLLYVPKNKRDKREAEQRRILKDFKFSPKLTQFILAIRRSGIERFSIKKYERKISTIRLPLLQETARRTNLSLSQLNALHYEELRDLLLKDKDPNLQEVNERAKNYFMYVRCKNKKLDVFLLSGEKAIRESQRLIAAVFGSSVNTLKGEVAYSGKVRGKARVFPFFALQKDLAKHMKTMEDKKILVSVHTVPQMIPVALKASAIVTEEGGINGHAAIVSREFKIPCIIGVGNATERIKTGMEIEVDATNGVVTIID